MDTAVGAVLHDVRLWHQADIAMGIAHVSFRPRADIGYQPSASPRRATSPFTRMPLRVGAGIATETWPLNPMHILSRNAQRQVF